MQVEEFDYDLPGELIAQRPLDDRSGARMLVLDRRLQTWTDRQFRDLPSYLQPGDCLILNDTRVLPSRVFGQRAGGPGKVEALLLRALPDENNLVWEALVRPGKKIDVGERLVFSDTFGAEVIGRGERGLRILRLTCKRTIEEELTAAGHVPLPHYIHREDTVADRERYQTVFARVTGSVAAPTAGLHFTPEVLDECRRAGATVAHVTLHAGLGTFQPLGPGPLEGVRLHAERYEVAASAFEQIRHASRRVAVGTTSVRAIESAYLSGGAASQDTRLFISPGFRFQATGAMLTNFHLPQSSLLILVAAFAGKDFILGAYAHAVREKYRFYSYGDCMLIL